MELHNMKPTPGSRQSKKRVGRGDKTAGRGQKGQKARAGYSRKIGFEGGQNPLYKRIPKRGFNNINKIEYTIINLDQLEKLSENVITPELLVEKNIIKASYGRLKVLGNGEITKKIEISAHKISKSALEAIESKGGKITIIEA